MWQRQTEDILQIKYNLTYNTVFSKLVGYVVWFCLQTDHYFWYLLVPSFALGDITVTQGGRSLTSYMITSFIVNGNIVVGTSYEI